MNNTTEQTTEQAQTQATEPQWMRERRERFQTFEALSNAIAHELNTEDHKAKEGDKWQTTFINQFEDDDQYPANPTFILFRGETPTSLNPTNLKSDFLLLSPLYNDITKAHIEGPFGTAYRDDQTPRPSTVQSIGKGPKAIARQIVTRFLPNYRADLERLQRKAAKRQGELDEAREFGKQLEQAAQGAMKYGHNQNETFPKRLYSVPKYGTAHTYPDSAGFELSQLSKPQALQIARLLGQWHNGQDKAEQAAPQPQRPANLQALAGEVNHRKSTYGQTAATSAFKAIIKEMERSGSAQDLAILAEWITELNELAQDDFNAVPKMIQATR